MSFPFNVYLLAFGGAWLTALLTLPAWRAWCLRIGLVDDPGHRKIHQSPIPLAGGLAVLTGILVPTVAAILLIQSGLTGLQTTSLTHGLGARRKELAAIFFGAVTMVALGLWDDKYELRASVKFAGQLFIAAIVAGAGVRVTLFVPSIAFSYAITVLWILTVINAFNFMDNMNGLCAGLGAIGAFCFAAFAAVSGQYLVALLALLVCGALLGFLPYNFPKAGAFLGDAGSHLVGYLLAVLAILPHFYTQKNPRVLAVLTPLLILAIPLLDLVWVVALRWRRGQPFYIGDTNHLSHRLVRRGLSPVRAVLLIWLLATVLGVLAFI
ncbi:MAG: undecaprenyl/decaprenyl-phosphate alpha-N-acetylglucosaminyl 1-phosphate transferase [Verrucomicrobia bacterium]|nr:undecaprenyl/decaprenyl-phosphate alpha-N-acetylglucosaminyl 1-phosphate transferase [Verrucomicrobiota bacterium]